MTYLLFVLAIVLAGSGLLRLLKPVEHSSSYLELSLMKLHGVGCVFVYDN